MSRSPAMSGKATAMKLSKEKCLSSIQLTREKGEKEVGGFSTVTIMRVIPGRAIQLFANKTEAISEATASFDRG